MSLGLTFIIMAKEPIPGRVKTRLMTGGGLSALQAAQVARAMLECTLVRITAIARSRGYHVVLAVTPDDACERLRRELGPTGSSISFRPQGRGDLGERIMRQWDSLGGAGAAFFGIDTPDLPFSHVEALIDTLDSHDAAVGPTGDGGYWSIAAREPIPIAFKGIAWGSKSVLRQTLQQIRKSGRSCSILPTWNDVDHPADLRDLLAGIEKDDLTLERDQAITALSRRLKEILDPISAGTNLADTE